MSFGGSSRRIWLWPTVLAGAGALVLLGWLAHHPQQPLALRVPGTDAAPGQATHSVTNPVLLGQVIPGSGIAADLPGLWPQFRGPHRDGIMHGTELARSWPQSAPKVLWSIPVGDGYAGPAIAKGCVYLMDYDVTHRHDTLRCLSLADGKEIWRYSYPVNIKRNHGMSRTVPAVTEKQVIAIGPKGHVVCCDAVTGELRWSLDLVREYGVAIPEWYVGQCPLVDGDRVILAPGGPDALLLAVELATGREVWRTPNPNGWKMTHSSIMPVDFAGKRLYVYCANNGVVGVDAANGALLWETTDWKIAIATVPSPCILDHGRIFLSGGYNAGSLMLQLEQVEGAITASTKFKLNAATFGATQHTPIFHNGLLYGTRADGKFVCLSPDGKVLWTSGKGDNLGLGSYLLADGLIFAVNDSGELRLIEATPNSYKELARATVIPDAHESWGPMALVGNRLLVRDLTQLVCLDAGPIR